MPIFVPIQMVSGSATMLFDLCEVDPLIPTWLFCVKRGNGVEANGIHLSFGHDVVCHADNRRRVDAATQLSKDRGIRA